MPVRTEPVQEFVAPVRAAARRHARAGLRRAWGRLRDWRPEQVQWWAVRALTPRRVVRSRGLRFTLRCGNWVTQYRWQSYNEKEPETLDWMDRRLRDGDVLFDVGANVGVYALYAARRHPRLRVVAFEPECGNLHLLRDNLMDNQLHHRVEVYGIALSDRSGVSRLHLQDLLPGSALHTESVEPIERTLAGRPVIWREGIATVTLDAFCEQTGLRPDALKLDVDGSEPRILEGARKTLGSLRSVILEMPEDPAARGACEARLGEEGLVRWWRDPRGASRNEIWERSA